MNKSSTNAHTFLDRAELLKERLERFVGRVECELAHKQAARQHVLLAIGGRSRVVVRVRSRGTRKHRGGEQVDELRAVELLEPGCALKDSHSTFNRKKTLETQNKQATRAQTCGRRRHDFEVCLEFFGALFVTR